MNTSGYLILITALLGVAAFMIYARFAARSRGNSSELPSRESFPDESARASLSQVPVEAISGGEEGEVVVATAQPLQAETDSRSEEREYFDELQEAAAGLAVLMRSSPVQNPSGPVVFAPEDDLEPAVKSETEESHAAVELVEDELEILGATPSVEVVSTPETDEIEEPDEAPAPSISEILGEEVAGQFGLIDSGLDDLEALVASLEDSLVGLVETDSAGSASSGEEMLGEAA